MKRLALVAAVLALAACKTKEEAPARYRRCPRDGSRARCRFREEGFTMKMDSGNEDGHGHEEGHGCEEAVISASPGFK